MRTLVFSTCLVLVLAVGTANAGAILLDGNVQLGVDDYGQLNVPGGTPSAASPFFGGTTDVGVRFAPYNNESTSDGCLCEGWGVGTTSGAAVDSGWANNSEGGAFGLSLSSFTATATTAESVVTLANGLRITHSFALAVETVDLFRVTVKIENLTGADIDELVYRRIMDWDVDPTTFDEYVTIAGAVAATAVVASVDNGFDSADPFSPLTSILATGDFTDSGPTDHGAGFDFDFGALADGDTFEFEIFYGGSYTEADAIAALVAVGAEVYSLGQPNNDPLGLGLPFIDPAGDSFPTNTFIFGFKGVGGDPIIPEPSTIALFGLGAFALVGVVRRRRRSTTA